MAIPAASGFWSVVVADPGPFGLFSGAVYDRGAATLFALRQEIGDEAFLEGARTWVSRYDDGTAGTADFQAVMEESSGQDLDTFFDVWVRTGEKPTSW
jgi:aminopeptidase N